MDKEELENQIEETSKEQPKKRERTKIEKIIIDLVCGVAVGAGAILPGFSGGVLCVVLGMYPLIMELFSHPFKAFKKHWKIYMFIGIGWGIGFFAVSNVIKFMYARYEVFTIWAFVGMIFGNIPSLYKQAGKKGRKASSFISMAVAFIVMFAILFSVAMLPDLNITPNVWWYLFSGFMWGLSIIIPGLTSSSIMMSLGIYESFNAGLAGFKPIVIIPWVVGMILTAAELARLVEYIFKKHYSEAFHAVIGIVVSSTIMIFPIFHQYKLSDIFISAACVIIGFIVAYFLSNFKIEEQTEQETT